jgi:hypothetical protein
MAKAISVNHPRYEGDEGYESKTIAELSPDCSTEQKEGDSSAVEPSCYSERSDTVTAERVLLGYAALRTRHWPWQQTMENDFRTGDRASEVYCPNHSETG